MDVLNQELSVDAAEVMINEVMDAIHNNGYWEGHSDGYHEGYSSGRSSDNGYSEIQSNYQMEPNHDR